MSGCITVTNTFTGLPGGSADAGGGQMAADAHQEPRYIYVYPNDSSAYTDRRYDYDSRYDYRRYRGYDYYPDETRPRYRSTYPPVTSNDPMPRRNGGDVYEEEVTQPSGGDVSPRPQSDDRLRGDMNTDSPRWQNEGENRRPDGDGSGSAAKSDQRASSSQEEPVKRAEPTTPINATQEPHPETPTVRIPSTAERRDPAREASSRRDEEQASRVPSQPTKTPSVATGPAQTTTTSSGSTVKETRRADDGAVEREAQKKSAKSGGIGLERPVLNTNPPATSTPAASGAKESSATIITPTPQRSDTVKPSDASVNAGKEINSGSGVQAAPRRASEPRSGSTETSVRQPAVDKAPGTAIGGGIGLGAPVGSGAGSVTPR